MTAPPFRLSGPERTSVSYDAVSGADQRADHQVGDGRAHAGDVVVAGPGRVVAAVPVLVPVVMSWKSLSGLVQDVHDLLRARAVERGLAARARPWSAIASSADHCGAPALVPPTLTQSRVVPLYGTES